MSKKFKVKITETFYVKVDQESFDMLKEAASEGDMQMIHEQSDDSYKEECTVEKVIDEKD
jgi:hypothetical protein